ncbi:hypothetical protein KQ51_00911 [Candidatus Izimaplasma bacterium HR1]|jgi:uncharacterized membrane-anchored protein YitT (DUF2179 family)|uniref:YitT family protein n=1 Tax=Candidatus Izimoplasma sp. HR1 TaxID=1541959 RepID=UPI0004F85032|nr:hypothetical protein KQ51_00911 [Candidatus Izimaplasma bacterium HR1]
MFNRTRIRQISKPEQYIMISLGIVLMVSGFYFFLIPAEIVAGGVTGLGLVLNTLFDFPIAITVLIFNMFLLILGLVILGKKIFFRSIYGSLLFPAVLYLFERFVPLFDLQNDLFISVIFGGTLLGIGFGVVLKYGGTSGGTDIPVKILNKKFNIPVSFSIYLIDGIIVALGIVAFFDTNGILGGLYALISIYISGRVADVVIVGSNSKKAMQIITDFPEEIKNAIYSAITRGVTEVSIKGGYTKDKKTMLVTVITRQEYYIIRNIIAKIDENAFVYVTPATEIHGDFFERESE